MQDLLVVVGLEVRFEVFAHSVHFVVVDKGAKVDHGGSLVGRIYFSRVAVEVFQRWVRGIVAGIDGFGAAVQFKVFCSRIYEKRVLVIDD